MGKEAREFFITSRKIGAGRGRERARARGVRGLNYKERVASVYLWRRRETNTLKRSSGYIESMPRRSLGGEGGGGIKDKKRRHERKEKENINIRKGVSTSMQGAPRTGETPGSLL